MRWDLQIFEILEIRRFSWCECEPTCPLLCSVVILQGRFRVLDMKCCLVGNVIPYTSIAPSLRMTWMVSLLNFVGTSKKHYSSAYLLGRLIHCSDAVVCRTNPPSNSMVIEEQEAQGTPIVEDLESGLEKNSSPSQLRRHVGFDVAQADYNNHIIMKVYHILPS